jgi:hypothetical protein
VITLNFIQTNPSLESWRVGFLANRSTRHRLTAYRSAALEHVGLHHKTLIFSVGGCALPDDVANEYIFTDKYGCSREKPRGQPALITDEVMSLLR